MSSNFESDKTTSTTISTTTHPSSSSSLKAKLTNLAKVISTADTIIGNIQAIPSEENVRKELGKLINYRDLSKREACPHGCTFLCRMCDG